MPSSGQRQHQSRRRQQSRPAVLLPQLPAAAPLEAPPWPRLVPRMPLGRKAATPPRPLLLPVETMMVTLHHALLTTRAMFSRGVLFWSVDHRLCFLFFIASRQQQKPKTELSRLMQWLFKCPQYENTSLWTQRAVELSSQGFWFFCLKLQTNFVVLLTFDVPVFFHFSHNNVVCSPPFATWSFLEYCHYQIYDLFIIT